MSGVVFLLFDLAGTAVFAATGALAASGKRMDLFGVVVIAVVTAIGGGTMRDLLMGAGVFWLHNLTYLAVSCVAALLVAYASRYVSNRWDDVLLYADAAGLGLFTVIGIERGLQMEYGRFACLLLGAVTAVGGGVLRDILCSRIPIIFRSELYACAALLGGGLYLALLNVPCLPWLKTLIVVFAVFLIRIVAHYRRIRLPII